DANQFNAATHVAVPGGDTGSAAWLPSHKPDLAEQLTARTVRQHARQRTCKALDDADDPAADNRHAVGGISLVPDHLPRLVTDKFDAVAEQGELGFRQTVEDRQVPQMQLQDAFAIQLVGAGLVSGVLADLVEDVAR